MARYRSARRELVWGGLALALVGLVVATYSVTGDRIYDITWAPVFVLAATAALAGAAVAAYGRAGPRTRAEPLLPLREDEDLEAAGEEEPAEATGGPPSGPEPASPDDEGSPEIVAIDCPDCGARFREEGVRPFQARCPECGLPGRIPAEAPGG